MATKRLVLTFPMLVSFTPDKCIACELCVPACPYRAVEIVS